jgi:hypothetical protein
MDDDKQPENPENLTDFLNNVFGGAKEAQEFAEAVEKNQRKEAWKGMYELFTGMRQGCFTFSQACGVMGAYMFYLLSSVEEDGGSIE